MLQEFGNAFKLIVNVTKTKVLVFKEGGRLSKVEKWFYNNSQIETVNGFSYVGVVFFHNKGLCLKWPKAKKALNHLLVCIVCPVFFIKHFFKIFD